MGLNIASAAETTSYNQPCNTPTATRGAAPWLSDHTQEHYRTSRSNSLSNERYQQDEMEEDERMVEELLAPTSPAVTSPTTSWQSKPWQSNNAYAQQQRPVSQESWAPVNADSNFASTDPFYLAQLQAEAERNRTQSLFAQAGQPNANSPFLQQSGDSRRTHVHAQHHLAGQALYAGTPVYQR